MPLHCSRWRWPEWHKNQVNLTYGFGLTLAEFKSYSYSYYEYKCKKNSPNKIGYVRFVGSQPTLLLFDACVQKSSNALRPHKSYVTFFIRRIYLLRAETPQILRNLFYSENFFTNTCLHSFLDVKTTDFSALKGLSTLACFYCWSCNYMY